MKRKRPSSARRQRALKARRHAPDSEIDFSDNPESTGEELRRARPVFRSLQKKQNEMRQNASKPNCRLRLELGMGEDLGSARTCYSREGWLASCPWNASRNGAKAFLSSKIKLYDE